jgi:DNA-binding MarR family transcriptional regulator
MNDNPSEPLSDQVFHRLLTLLHYSRKHARLMMDESGLTPRDFSVLRYLMELDSATVGQVQAYLHKSPSTTSTLIAQLEEKGYLTRRRSQADNRVVIVALTSAGRGLAEETPLGGLPLLRRELGHLPEQHLLEMDAVLNEILQLMEAAEDQ